MKINHDIKRQNKFLKELRRWMLQRNVIGFAINRFQWHFYPRLFMRKDYPLHIDIETTSHCQMNCPMCFRAHKKIPKEGNMSFDTFRKIIDEIEGNVYSIKFTGRGEPLLNAKFPDFMRYLRGKKFGEIGMITNGQFMNETIMLSIIENGLDFVSFSVDGLKSDYDRIRAPMTYERIFSTVSALHEMKKKLGATKPLIRITSVDKYMKGAEDEFIKQWAPVSDDIMFQFFKDYDHDAPNIQDSSLPCPFLYQRMMIHWDGTIPMCINDEYETNVLGDISSQTIKEIWNGLKFEESRKGHRAGKRDSIECCRNCALFREGHGKKNFLSDLFTFVLNNKKVNNEKK
ncbi:MAG: hypothetical protein COS94_01160 [Candidatus Hydrogenedentes bacterium CG07_land_8_20_14_0_80_42_17]|nr:MAG: hypothetical protein AUJ18_07790 [Candidatus Hydrogenedentes bacterium CG1_02_42_14]PIU48620.1 MAG: hypothetical protein COS94_01160 [Candidatus Hydrogenedentes bacterium CG07_land_8_20_14_0_80_42_17]